MLVNIPKPTFSHCRRLKGTLDLPASHAKKLIEAGLATEVKSNEQPKEPSKPKTKKRKAGKNSDRKSS